MVLRMNSSSNSGMRYHIKGQKQKLSSAVDINRLCMENVHYMRYSGSLTTPPCSENVVWTMLGHVHEVSPQQVAQFGTLWGSRSKRMVMPDLCSHWVTALCKHTSEKYFACLTN